MGSGQRTENSNQSTIQTVQKTAGKKMTVCENGEADGDDEGIDGKVLERAFRRRRDLRERRGNGGDIAWTVWWGLWRKDDDGEGRRERRIGRQRGRWKALESYFTMQKTRKENSPK